MNLNQFNKNVTIVFVFVLSGLSGFALSLYINGRESVTERGNVQVVQTFHYPAIWVKQIAGDPNAGEKIFKEFCATCHAKKPQINIRAPRIGDKRNWRMLHRTGMQALLRVTTQGIGAMPARGGCFECTDEQLQATIQYILNQSDA